MSAKFLPKSRTTEGPTESVIEPHDHENFDGERPVIRRLRRENHVVFDENLAADRVSSALFKHVDPAKYLSIDSGVCIDNEGLDVPDYILEGGWDGAVVVAASDLREALTGTPIRIGMAPLPGLICHGAIWGKITKGRANAALRKCDWLIPIPGVQLAP